MDTDIDLVELVKNAPAWLVVVLAVLFLSYKIFHEINSGKTTDRLITMLETNIVGTYSAIEKKLESISASLDRIIGN